MLSPTENEAIATCGQLWPDVAILVDAADAEPVVVPHIAFAAPHQSALRNDTADTGPPAPLKGHGAACASGLSCRLLLLRGWRTS